MRVSFALLLLAALSACDGEPSAAKEAAGTPADPVTVCKRAADVCRYQGAKLGVCTIADKGAQGATCAASGQCFICAPQH